MRRVAALLHSTLPLLLAVLVSASVPVGSAFAACGDGILDPGEACDFAIDPTCCSAACADLDGDDDGVCDAADVCPQIADPAQVDSDGDGAGDACDTCTTTNLGQTEWSRRRLTLTRIDDLIATNDHLRLNAQFSLANSNSSIEPGVRGARIQIRSALGDLRVDIALPPGQLVPPGPGWLVKGDGSQFIFRDRRSGGTSGIARMAVRSVGGGTVRVRLVGRKGMFPVLPSDVPLVLTLTLGDQASAEAGDCGEVTFAPGDCRVGAGGHLIGCR